MNETSRSNTDAIGTAAGHRLALRLIAHIGGRTAGFRTRTSLLDKLETTPAAGAAYRFTREGRCRNRRIADACPSARGASPSRFAMCVRQVRPAPSRTIASAPAARSGHA
ncbi:hypothetical protein [Burkholderia glumae]